MTQNPNDTVRALEWTDEGLRVLDQRKLPQEIVYEYINSARNIAIAIETMRVRGAPAIGIAAAYGVVLAVRSRVCQTPENWQAGLEKDFSLLAESRPTAVNLFWALDRMKSCIRHLKNDPVSSLLDAAKAIHAEDIAANRLMGKLGAELLQNANGVLTHCNTGSLATGGYGTALGVIRCATEKGLTQIFATETRPWMQGARLTVWELQQDKIPATLVADSAAAQLMRSGKVQWVIVGADRIAKNGDVANKIGTYSLAVLARHHGLKFMVVAPTSSIDWDTVDGDGISIEYRDRNELLDDYFQRDDSVINAWNPVFDITPAQLIDAIVTEKGVVTGPSECRLAKLRAT